MKNRLWFIQFLNRYFGTANPDPVIKDPNSALFYAYRYKFGPEDVGRIKRFHNLLAVPKGNCIVVYRIEESNFIEVTSFSVPNHYARFLYMQVFHDDVDLRPRYLFTFWTMRKPGMGPHLARFDDQGTCIDTAECEDPPYLFQLDQDVAIYTYSSPCAASEHFRNFPFFLWFQIPIFQWY